MNPYTQTYTYDAGTNLVSLKHQLDGGTATRQYQPVRPTSNRQQAGQYDQAGNQLSRKDQDDLAYNSDGSLAYVRWQEGGYQITEYYTYASPGVRARKVTEVRTTLTGLLVQVETVSYVGEVEFRASYTGTDLNYDGDVVTTANGHAVTPVSQRTVTRIKSGHGQVGKIDKNEHTGQPPTVTYNVLNHLDSNELALDELGNLAHYRHYAPYGETLEGEKIESTLSELGYSGQEEDDTGLVYYGHRYYLKNGIWQQADPIRFEGGQMNLYAMVGGNPATWRDVRGLAKVNDYENYFILWILQEHKIPALHDEKWSLESGFNSESKILKKYQSRQNNEVQKFLYDAYGKREQRHNKIRKQNWETQLKRWKIEWEANTKNDNLQQSSGQYDQSNMAELPESKQPVKGRDDILLNQPILPVQLHMTDDLKTLIWANRHHEIIIAQAKVFPEPLKPPFEARVYIQYNQFITDKAGKQPTRFNEPWEEGEEELFNTFMKYTKGYKLNNKVAPVGITLEEWYKRVFRTFYAGRVRDKEKPEEYTNSSADKSLKRSVEMKKDILRLRQIKHHSSKMHTEATIRYVTDYGDVLYYHGKGRNEQIFLQLKGGHGDEVNFFESAAYALMRMSKNNLFRNNFTDELLGRSGLDTLYLHSEIRALKRALSQVPSGAIIPSSHITFMSYVPEFHDSKTDLPDEIKFHNRCPLCKGIMHGMIDQHFSELSDEHALHTNKQLLAFKEYARKNKSKEYWNMKDANMVNENTPARKKSDPGNWHPSTLKSSNWPVKDFADSDWAPNH